MHYIRCCPRIRSAVNIRKARTPQRQVERQHTVYVAESTHPGQILHKATHMVCVARVSCSLITNRTEGRRCTRCIRSICAAGRNRTHVQAYAAMRMLRPTPPRPARRANA